MNATNQIQIDLSEVENLACEVCASDVFVPVFVIKKVSALLSPTGKETLAPLQIFKCDKCSYINELFLQGLTN